VTIANSQLRAEPPSGLGFHSGDRFPDLVLPGASTDTQTRLFEQGGDQILVHLFASW